MSDKKLCPFLCSVLSVAGEAHSATFHCTPDCAIYDEDRKCCGLRQIASEPRISIMFPTSAPSVGGGSGADKPIATLHDDGTISGEWSGGTICGGWSRGTADKKGGAEINDV